jgi:hypothetical protein
VFFFVREKESERNEKWILSEMATNFYQKLE